MKIKNSVFLAKANLKGNTKTTSVLITTLILVISLTMISSFSTTVQRRVEEYKADPRAKIIGISPTVDFPDEKNSPLDQKTINRILEIEHVKSISIAPGMMYENFETISMDTESGQDSEYMKILERKGDAWLYFTPLIGDEERPVIAGKTLEESPVMSCIIPDKFYPFDDVWVINNTTEYLDGRDYIGKTITVKPATDTHSITYIMDTPSSKEQELPALEYKLKIVGVYRDTPTTYGDNSTVFVSFETGNLMEEMAVNASSIDITSDTAFARWWNAPEYHDHFVTVDNYNNLEYVYQKLDELQILHDDMPYYILIDGTLEMAAIFKTVSLILTIAAIILGIIIMVHSSVNSLVSRRSEIGLLKAIGYKDKQIFSALFYEQIIITLKGFLIGGIFSVAIVTFVNYINGYTSKGSDMFIVSWIDVSFFLALSLAIVIIVPLLCQVIMLYKLRKIQPREAMS